MKGIVLLVLLLMGVGFAFYKLLDAEDRGVKNEVAVELQQEIEVPEDESIESQEVAMEKPEDLAVEIELPDEGDDESETAVVENKIVAEQLLEFPVSSLQLDRQDRGSRIGSPDLEKALQFAIDQGRFADLQQMLEKELYLPISQGVLDQGLLRQQMKNPTWRHALNVYSMIHALSLDTLGDILESGEKTKKFCLAALTHPQGLEQYLSNITKYDSPEGSFKIWRDIWVADEDEEGRTKYLNVAIACALVFDTDKFVKIDNYSTEKVDPFDRYTIFTNNAKAHRLKADISKMPVSDLVWVVDVPLSAEEIEWAVSKANFNRRSWGRAYGHIDYLMERAVNGENPYEEYTLSEIEKHGGICGDQSYFSANTAKANGIPASGVTGSGNRGGHAWLAYKPSKYEWDTTTGRYENYSNGSATNPQTNQRISEFDFYVWSDREMREQKMLDAKQLLRLLPLMVRMGHERAGQKVVYEEVFFEAALLEDAWIGYIDFLSHESPALTKDGWKALVARMERNFKKHPSMWMTARKVTQKYLWDGLEIDAIRKNQDRYRREIARKFPARSDIIQQVLEDQEKVSLVEADFKEVRSFYREAMRLFGEDALNFKFMAKRYFEISKKFPDSRKLACDDIERHFRRKLDTESGDYFTAKTEVGLMKMIAGFYQQAGDQRKAQKMKKEAGDRLKKSAKQAL